MQINDIFHLFLEQYSNSPIAPGGGVFLNCKEFCQKFGVTPNEFKQVVSIGKNSGIILECTEVTEEIAHVLLKDLTFSSIIASISDISSSNSPDVI